MSVIEGSEGHEHAFYQYMNVTYLIEVVIKTIECALCGGALMMKQTTALNDALAIKSKDT